jgi:hypothetical protein
MRMRLRLRLRLRLRERERERERERRDQVCVEFVGHVLQIELGAVLGVVHVETHFDHRLRILGGQRVAHRRSATASRQACCEASPDGLLLEVFLVNRVGETASCCLRRRDADV